MDENENIPYQIDFANGKTVSGRWVITSRIGSGAYGVVYAVQDNKDKDRVAALKVEMNQESESSMLKLEFEVLQRLQDRPWTVRLFGAGKRADYSFLVITLCGADLAKIRQEKKISKFTESTTLRVGVHALYAVKQLHEVGYIHRDIKPQNFVIGGTEKDSRILYLIDFGMVRQYAVPDERPDDTGKPIKDGAPKKWLIRKARKKVLLRGTLRYCSLNVHKRMEQGRADDIYSLIYMLIEMRFPLPWTAAQREERLIALKEGFAADANVNKCEGMRDILCYLQNVSYSDRPDYKFIYNCLMEVIKKKKYRFSDPYDWEDSVKASPPKKLDDSGRKKKEITSNKKVTTPPVTSPPPVVTTTTAGAVPTIYVEKEPSTASASDATNTATASSITDSTYSNKSDGTPAATTAASSSNAPADAREIQSSTSMTTSTSPPVPLEETTARDDSLRKYQDAKETMDKPSEKKKKAKKAPTLEEEPPVVVSTPPSKKKHAEIPSTPGDKSSKKKKPSASSPAPPSPSSGPSSGRPVEKSLYIEFSKYKKDAVAVAPPPSKDEKVLVDDEFYPTAAPTSFDFKPGDIPSGSSAALRDQDKQQQNSTRSDIKNMKSVMSSYGTPPAL